MSILSITAAVPVIFLLAYRFYGRFLAEQVFCFDDARPTPAVTLRDGVDYEPTAAEPITGPILACLMSAACLILCGVIVTQVVTYTLHFDSISCE